MAGLIRGMARTAVVAGTATAVSGNVSRRQAARYGQQDAAAAAPSNGADPQVAQLQQLAQLKDQGIITQQEFDAKKSQILGI